MKVKALLVLTLLLPSVTAIQAQQSNKEPNVAPAAQQEQGEAQRRKADLEIEKLRLEVSRLQESQAGWSTWLVPLLGLLIGAISTFASFTLARRGQRGATDQVTHEKRLEAYPKLVEATSPLAVYFPVYDVQSGAAVSREACVLMGRRMSDWYFKEGGLLMTETSKNAYFRLAQVLTRAALADDELNVPKFPADLDKLSVRQLTEYRKDLKLEGLADKNWKFGSSVPYKNSPPHLKFRDYVFLQWVSSELRTQLTEDLRSRRPPS